MFREGTLCKLNKILCLMIDRSEEEHVAWKDEQGERGEGSDLADTGPPRTELDETLMLVEELKTFAEVEQDIDSGTDQHDADDTHRWNEDEESDRVTEPTFYEHNAQDEPVHPLLAFLSPLLDEEEPLAWKIESDQGEGHDSNAGQPRKEVEETSILVEELKTRVCRVYQTFTEVEKNVDSGTDQWEEETESTITQKVQDRAAEPTVNEDKAQDEPVSAIEAGWQMDTPGQQRPTESDGYEKMISAIVGEQLPTRTPRAPVSRDVVIPATVERLRALKLATYNKEINLMGSHGPDLDVDALPGSRIDTFHNHYGMVSTMNYVVLQKVQTGSREIKSILLTPTRRHVRDALHSSSMMPTRRVHFKIARKLDGPTLHPVEPGSVYIKIWQQLMLLPIIWEIWSFPFRLAFGNIETDVNTWGLPVDGVADCMFLSDIVVGFMTIIPASTFPNQPDIANSFRDIIRLRVRHELFWLLSPILIYQLIILNIASGIWIGPPGQASWLWWSSGIPRVAQRLRRFVFYFESILVDPTIKVQQLQAFRLALIICLSAHWVGSIFYFLARLQGFGSTTWLADFESLLPKYTMQPRIESADYLLCIYKGFNALSNLAYDGGIPMNEVEMVFSLMVMLMQVYISALILGTLLNYLVRKDPQEEAHKQQMANVRLFMDQKNIPQELHQRVDLYLEFQFKKNRQNAVSSLIDLPKSLRIKVANANYREIVDKCVTAGRAFAGCKDQFLNAMLVKLHVSHVMSGDHVVQRDDLPLELYFVLSGSVQVVDENDHVQKTVRSDVPDLPPIVGEVPFFLRINHFLAITASLDHNVQLLVLNTEDSIEIFNEFPENHATICENLMSTFDLTNEGKQIPGIEDDLSDPNKLGIKKRIVESMEERTEKRFLSLCQAANTGDPDTITLLARQGANLDRTDYDRRSAMHIACQEGHFRVVEALVQNGAQVC